MEPGDADRVPGPAVRSGGSATRPAAAVGAGPARRERPAAVVTSRAGERTRLTESRARVLAEADESRRRLQRDLHDGPQQRLTHALIALRLAQGTVEAGSTTASLVEEALTNVERAARQIRDLVDGILPRSLTHGGLRTGLESLVAGLPVPVALHWTAPRCPAATEVTAYLVAVEALTNVVRHSRARVVTVTVHVSGGRLVVEVRDDGVGGADTDGGSGLRGLADRFEALDGSLRVWSPAGRGTRVRAEIPCA